MYVFNSANRSNFFEKGMASNMTIVIDGIIGAGKSTVAKYLCQALEINFYEELNEEASDSLAQRMLDRFYSDPERWSAIIQVMFLSERFEAIKTIEAKSERAIIDRSIYGDEIFAKTLHDRGEMSADEFEIYQNLLKTLIQQIKPPEVVIYLDVSVDTALERIKKRDRSTESSLIPRDYMEDLRKNYEAWFDAYDLSRKIRIDFNEHALDDSGDLSKALQEKLLKLIE